MLNKLFLKPITAKIITWIAILIIGYFFIWAVYLDFNREFDPDEFQHVHISWCMKEGMSLYRDIIDYHGPMYAIINATIWKIFNLPDSFFTIFLFRSISVIFMFAIVALTFRIAKLLYGSNIAWISSALLISSYTFFRKAMEIRPDVMMTFFFLLGLYLMLKAIQKNTPDNKLLAYGIICFSFALTFHLKISIPIVLFLIGFIICTSKRKLLIKQVYWIVIPFSLILFVLFISGSLSEFIGLTMGGIQSTITQLQTRNLHFPLFNKEFFGKDFFLFLSAFAFLYRGKSQRLFFFCSVIGTIIIVNLDKFAQWYLMVIPLMSILAAAGTTKLFILLKQIKRAIGSFYIVASFFIVIFIFFSIQSIQKISLLLDTNPNNKEQIEFTNYVMSVTTRQDKIFAIWSNVGGYMFRPHAFKNAWIIDESPSLYLESLIKNGEYDFIIVKTNNEILQGMIRQYTVALEHENIRKKR